MPISKNRVSIKASELLDVDVDKIALVRTPASRAVFGIMKNDSQTGDKGMFDLTSIFKSDRKPVVASVLIKGEPAAGVLAALKEAGFAVDEVQKQEDVNVYPQDVEAHSELSIVKLSDNLAFAVTAIKADGYFAEMAAARGFYPSLSIASELLECELYKCIEKSDSPSAAAEKMGGLISDFQSFMTSMVSSLPAMVFKAEELIAKSEEAGSDPAPAAKTDKEEANTDTAAKSEDDKANAEKSEDAATDDSTSDDDTVEKGDADVEAEAKPEGDEAATGDVEKSEDDDAENVEKSEEEGSEDKEAEANAAMIAAIAKSVTESLQPKFDALGERVDGFEQRIAKAEGEAEDARSAVFGGVFDEPKSKTTAKAESRPVARIDTGFAR